MPSGRYAFDPQWVVVVFRPFGGGEGGGRALDRLCGYNLLEEKGVCSLGI